MFHLLRLLCLREGCQKKWGVVVAGGGRVIGECERRDCRCLAQSIHPAFCLCSTDTPPSLDSVGSSVPVKSNNSVSDGLLASTRRHPGSCSGNVKKLARRGEVALRPGSAHFFFLPQLLLAFLSNVKSFTWNELHKTFGENSWRMSGAGP